ncbi:PucR family transcriptional regulator [Alkalihalobacterium chitinilyticum]|uniref:PucR family transcriptional regulator ligand-binding domain-containing protein n=1 Tax=Alkalihalobacterium chitinilyticum TaxID=2980103 RepID=A0ABT5VHP1_9BACI|nr:PucR family transcriptional regulator [Alkalihalobacterium chitinilyticum]MDE5414827.1 PucR family transcriptional regulator ligand-binding domain-containing protein [Alkalihalobacterium chitinilyticum]
MKSYITIKEILQRKHFDKTEVVAGVDGLNRNVKWVHVVEVINIRKLLNGHELILTTGLGWKDNTALFISFLKQLIESNASGLCIELGTHTSNIPQEVIEIANEHQFPIILFHQEVAFVQITQDIHSLLINQQYQMISDLESYSQTLNKKLLEINQYEEILTFCQTFLDVQVVAFFDEDRIFIPQLSASERRIVLEKIEAVQHDSFFSIGRQPVQILGHQFAELVIVTDQREINEFDLLILDRTTTALAQYLLRDLYVEEKRRMEEAEWMTDWLDGHHSNEGIKEHLAYIEPGLKLNGGIVCTCKLHLTSQSSNLDGTYFKLLFRTIFEQQGFYVFSIEIRHHIVFILGNKRTPKTWKSRMADGFKRLNTADYSKKIKATSISFGVGKFVKQLSDIHISYQTAKETLRLQDKLSHEGKSYFYDDLHMYRILSLINRHSDLQEIVMEYLQPVMEYDRKYNGKLIETLKAYLACNGSKQETAKKLFVVRQTMYHRIEKLESLLGPDFMNSEKRLAIEFMLLAYDYLNMTETTNPTAHEI